MKDTDKAQFADALTSLAACLGVQLDRVMLRGYWLALNDLELCDINRACKALLTTTTSTYGRMPTPAQVRLHSTGSDPEALAAHAWNVVVQAIARHGTWTGVDFDDARINAAVRAVGGWRELGATNNEQLDWRRREFMAAFQGYMTQAPTADMARGLSSQGEQVFVETGLPGAKRLELQECKETKDRLCALIQGATKEGDT
jgi:hypothetical protein